MLTYKKFWSFLVALLPGLAFASEANLVLPDLSKVSFLGNVDGKTLLMVGIGLSFIGVIFSFIQYSQLKNLPVHKAMKEISELIYETCKTYLLTQGKFILFLELFIGAIMVWYFGFLAPAHDSTGNEAAQQVPIAMRVAIILFFSLLGIAGSFCVAWFGIRVNTFANSRTAFASLRGRPFLTYDIPLKAGMSIGMMLISVELILMLAILCFVPGYLAGPCFIGFAIGESLGASALRIAGGIFTKIADIGSDLMKIVFKIKEDDARNPGVIADCTGDNAGDSVGPSADGFETYGVTGVALITFIMLAAAGSSQVQTQLLVWIFAIRVTMILTSFLSYLLNAFVQKAKYKNAPQMDFEKPLTQLVYITSIVSIGMTFLVSWLLIPSIAGDSGLWWKLSLIITCGTVAGAVIPEMVKAFTSTGSRHVREVVTASKEGGASLNIISGLVAGNFSAYWLGMVMVGLMGLAYWTSLHGLQVLFPLTGTTIDPSPIFAFGLVAFGFLGMGPVTIAVDSYGPVTDNAQSIYELSLIEEVPNVKEEVKKDFGFEPDFDKAKLFLEENDGAGNTFKATAKPVLIGTAVVGATTMIFSILFSVTQGLSEGLQFLSLVNAPFLLGLVAGGAVIYWFTGASMQAVATGAYRAVEFIKRNIKLDGTSKASVKDSKRVVEICTLYAQKGMRNIFFAVFFATLAFACFEPAFFIGYLISIALFGLFQALFMANAGGAWDNAKKLVETELQAKGTELHAATVIGDTVGDPFKDTSSVALNPIIKFTTLFGLLAVELAISLGAQEDGKWFVPTNMTLGLSAAFFVAACFFVYQSFYGMRIKDSAQEASPPNSDSNPDSASSPAS
ncbi:MAG: sodium-translocating pyrophosphatase [Cystobacterineae bacterium]|nr:sodium-translocating pyrophosphatase [Cystobacterineae bacterium]